ncbi:MAG: transposase [Candidatus Scatovivens sp.]
MGMKTNYNADIYNMYEQECNKNALLHKEIKNYKLEISNLKYELDYQQKNFDNKIIKVVKDATTPFEEENAKLKKELDDAYKEINRLKLQIENDKNYIIDKLTNQVNKNSSNSGIPSSKELTFKKKKSGANTYNHREKSSKVNGGQTGHKGCTLTKKHIEEKIRNKNLKVIEIKHYIHGNKEETVKYKIGIHFEPYIEKHVFIYKNKYENKLPKGFYSDVTYANDIKTIITILGNYCSMSYSKIKELIYDITGGIINISEGTIDNIYEEFSRRSELSIANITKHILNGKYQHTDETTTTENGKETYYRGYANPLNVVYKYHHNKGNKPIENDNILTNYFGTIISDHDRCIFKYGTQNQDCIIHIGRYCKEGYDNVYETKWQIDLYYFLLRQEKNRKILSKFGQNYFNKEDIIKIEKEYDEILERAKQENLNIKSTYWKEKETALCNRLVKYKKNVLWYIYDFTIPYDNNFMERMLRMIKGKTKVSGGFRSSKGGERFGNIMSIIKTSKLRKLDAFDSIKQIFEGNVLFA